jgi:hypothetical protein
VIGSDTIEAVYRQVSSAHQIAATNNATDFYPAIV